MKKYMLKRILFSIFSLLVVIIVVMLLVYSAIDRKVIFQTDDVWNKKKLNEQVVYEYIQYQKYGYIDYTDYGSFVKQKYRNLYGEDYTAKEDFKASVAAINNAATYLDDPCVQEFIAAYEADGYDITYLEPVVSNLGKTKGQPKPGGQAFLVATRDRSVFARLWDYISHIVTVETKNDVRDESLTDRYIRFEKDPYSGLFAIVGSGTEHKYLLYFDDRFPWIHQNWLHINLGVSYTKYRNEEITEVITKPTGDIKKKVTQYPAMLGTDEKVETAIDFHSVRYNTGTVTKTELKQYGDKYTVYSYNYKGLSKLENSFVMGLAATLIAYMLGLPLGIWMARRKEKLVDKIGNIYIIFIMAVPSLAYIFIFASIGTTLFKLPYKFAQAEVKFLAYILPTISLALPSIGSLMKWMRRYMIDQMNADYVKFARAEGLSEKEIFSKHISRNAMIYLVHGIPGSILGCLTGAIITERVYGAEGVGNLLTAAINGHDNGIIVACTVFYTTLSILSLILGDLLLAKYDPRISLNADKGGGR